MRRMLAFICALCCGVPFAPVSGVAQSESWRRLPPVWEAGFELDVLARGVRLEELAARGRIYVEALEGEEYELRVRNPLPVRVAVALSVDGLNTIDARRSSSWDASKWVLEPYQTIRVTGWQMSTQRARKFYFTTERDSYAARMGRTSDLGVITAVFYREATPTPQPVTPPHPYPMPEPRSERRGDSEMKADASGEASRKQRDAGATAMRAPRDDDYAATGIGRSVENHVRWVNMNLERRPAAEVTIRYEYRPALVRLGVLPRPRADENALRRRERARGFEDPRFCPEP
ncbi:MAG TPA: hypothetical protein VGV59_05905 [Pyrinomonadaceae bacterium]|nr:hypothetical protein [Pyrinomonadaceae bacterium]